MLKESTYQTPCGTIDVYKRQELLESLSERHQMVITMEDGILSGGFGEKIASFYGSSDMKVKNYGLDKKFYDRYDPNELLKEVGMTPVQIRCV